MSLHESEWDRIVDELRRSPDGTHNLQPPCKDEVMRVAEGKLGAMPPAMREVLSRFNGAELFIGSGPTFTVLGIGVDDCPPYCDVVAQTQALREAFDLADSWVFGIWNYGSVWVLDSEGLVREWDSAMKAWGVGEHALLTHFEAMLRQAEQDLAAT